VADRKVDYLLIGGGLASARCAEMLREEGADGSILLVGREPDPPYDRPPLSKEYMGGKQGREDGYVLGRDWYEQNDVELLTRTSVMKLDAGERVAKLSSKEEVGFDKALLATGANVVRLRLDGCDLEGLHYLRSYGNADAIRADAEEAERVVLIGGSYIGTEVAATLTALGTKCSIVCMEEVTLERVFGKEVGRFFHGVLESHGVEIHGGEEVERFEGSDGRVSRVVTKSGKEIDCGCVVIGAGVTPDVMLAKAAGLELGDSGGVKVSSKLETSAPGIFAAGDIAEYDSVVHGKPLRIEHWDVAFDHETIPYFFSDLADWSSMEYVGPGSGDVVIRGSMDDGDFTAFYLSDARVTAALTVGRSDDLEAARKFIRDKATPEPAKLADPDTDLSSL
jgi:3-phenylpropionate/trans-cinnamate dioxygenase ferredoxin reductase subunit